MLACLNSLIESGSQMVRVQNRPHTSHRHRHLVAPTTQATKREWGEDEVPLLSKSAVRMCVSIIHCHFDMP